MFRTEQQYVYLIYALLYTIAVGLGMSAAEQWLTPPRVRRRVHFVDATFRSGDIVLFVNNDMHLFTDIKKVAMGSRFTHIALVYVNSQGEAYAWETDTHGHKVTPLLPMLHKKLQQGQTCVWRKLSKPVSSSRLEQFLRANQGQPYSYNLWRALMNRWFAALQMPMPVSTYSSLRAPRFCSQLVAETYEYLGVLDFSTAINGPVVLLPADFGMERAHQLPWTHQFALGAEIELLP